MSKLYTNTELLITHNDYCKLETLTREILMNLANQSYFTQWQINTIQYKWFTKMISFVLSIYCPHGKLISKECHFNNTKIFSFICNKMWLTYNY